MHWIFFKCAFCFMNKFKQEIIAKFVFSTSCTWTTNTEGVLQPHDRRRSQSADELRAEHESLCVRQGH